VPAARAAALALTGAAAGAVTELASTRVDDNFSIPVVVAVSVGALGAVIT
jgi:dolichol kinase